MRNQAMQTLNTALVVFMSGHNSAFRRMILRLLNGIEKPLNKVTPERNFTSAF